MGNRGRGIGILAMAGTAFLWSLAGLFIKLTDWNPIAIAGLRSLIASVVILAYLRHPKIHLSFAQVAAAIANAATMLLFVAANKTTTAANAILLHYLAPVLTVFVGAVLLKERTRVEHYVALPLVMAGMALIFADKLGSGQWLGNLLAVLSAFAFSLDFVFMRMQKDGSPLESSLLSHWLTAGLCLAISVFLPLPHMSLRSLGAVAMLGTAQIGLASILFAVAIKRVPAVQASLVAVIEPVFSPVWVFLVIGETPSLNTLIGGAAIVLAVATASVVSAHRKEEESADPGSLVGPVADQAASADLATPAGQ